MPKGLQLRAKALAFRGQTFRQAGGKAFGNDSFAADVALWQSGGAVPDFRRGQAFRVSFFGYTKPLSK